jgi:GNAT superfamily N-acetyltransferase
MSQEQFFVVRRCDGFYPFWHDVIDPAPIAHAKAVNGQLTRGETQNAKTGEAERYDIVSSDRVLRWHDGQPPLVRRLHHHDTSAIQAHLLSLNTHDRRLRFFREATDGQIRTYVQDIDWDHSLLFGAICSDRVVGIVEALFGRAVRRHHGEIAVSVDAGLRGRGLGGFLVGHAVDRARLLGVRQMSLLFLTENRPIQRIIRTLGGRVDMKDLIGTITTGAVDAVASKLDGDLPPPPLRRAERAAGFGGGSLLSTGWAIPNTTAHGNRSRTSAQNYGSGPAST